MSYGEIKFANKISITLGGFDLQDDDSATGMTDRVLSMLYQYLLSNQTLELNETFQVYLKILSVEHSKFKATQKPKKNLVKKLSKKVHLGQSNRFYNYNWAIDVPSVGLFANKCLLICVVLALAQHEYFENVV